MEKSDFRVLTKHCFLRGTTLSETKVKLDKYYSDSTPSYGINNIHDTVSHPSQLSVCSIFAIDICAWENSVQDGWRDYTQSTKNAFVWPFRSKIWPILTAIRKSFYVDLWRWVKHGSTTLLQNHVKGQKSGLNLVKVHQSVRKRNNWLGKIWLVFLGCTWSNLLRLLENGRTITGAYYAALLDRLVDEIRK